MTEETTTAVVTVQTSPARDNKYLALRTEVDALCLSITNMVVDSIGKVSLLTQDVNLGRKIRKEVEDLRKAKYTGPLDAIKADWMKQFALLTGPIDEAQKAAAKKLVEYDRVQQAEKARITAENVKQAQEAAELQRLIDEENERIRAKQQVDEETGEVTGPDLIEASPKPVFVAPLPVVTKVMTDQGSSDVKMVPKFLLTDIAKVPTYLLALNEGAVKSLLKAGVRQIDGLDIWEEPDVSWRSK